MAFLDIFTTDQSNLSTSRHISQTTTHKEHVHLNQYINSVFVFWTDIIISCFCTNVTPAVSLMQLDGIFILLFSLLKLKRTLSQPWFPRIQRAWQVLRGASNGLQSESPWKKALPSCCKLQAYQPQKRYARKYH